jgi:diacylglycerol kinase family enzyme
VTKAPLPILVNRGGGAALSAGDDLDQQLTRAFAESGVDISIQLLEGPETMDAVRRAASANTRVVVGGGDGTAACGAAALAGSGVEMALLPLGTLNHLARDLGIPAKLEDAVGIAANGSASSIDIGEVNGHVFVNNASIGLYPNMVRERDDYRGRKGWPKWLAAIPASWAVWARLPRHRLRVDMGAGQQPVVTPLLFVGNNLYSLERGAIGSRSSLAEGKLSVFAVAAKSRLALLWFGIRAMTGLVDRTADFVALGECESLTVHSHGVSVDVALDGEVRALEFPLHFQIKAGALRIVAPPKADAA